MEFEDWQLNRIRQAILAFQLLGSDSKRTKYTWPEVSNEIKEETGVEVPHSRLSKFVSGEPSRDPALNRQGIRHYPNLSPQRMEAVLQFLTKPGSTGYMLPPSDLEIYSPTSEAPLRLYEYLNGHSPTDPENEYSGFISLRSLQGLYSHLPASGNTGKRSLRFRDQSVFGLIQFSLTRFEGDTERYPEIFQADVELLKSECIDFSRYRGWAILTPEDNFILLGKDEESQKNVFYCTVGIDNAVYAEDKAIEAIVLQEFNFPFDEILIKNGNDSASLLERTNKQIANNVFLFKRNNSEN